MTPTSATSSSRATTLELCGVTKRYGNSAKDAKPAVEHLSLTVPAGEICVLVGPSGCGKTTAMRLVNRMIEMTSGDILLDGHTVNDRDPSDLRREIGYVIQQVGLFPHLDVADNIAAVPKLLGWDRRRIASRVGEMLDLVGLGADMEHRLPSQLSGGQRQRVGVARALAADPPLMLMDEPFGAIDPINRERLQDEFLRLQSEIKKTVVFVTHDIDEAIRMGDKIAILREGGELVQYDSPNEILAQPADEFVARFVGADRGLKRLALTKLEDIDLLKATTVREGESAGAPVDGNAAVVVDEAGRPLKEATSASHLQTVPASFTLREALSLMMTDSLRPVLVTDADGRVAGFVSIELINQTLHASAEG